MISSRANFKISKLARDIAFYLCFEDGGSPGPLLSESSPFKFVLSSLPVKKRRNIPGAQDICVLSPCYCCCFVVAIAVATVVVVEPGPSHLPVVEAVI
jgi:hypothetical protein